jgi:sarcosine oxidase subunit beta
MKVAVIGSGIAGLSTAYHLAKEGVEVTVFEKKTYLYGASGRNSGGVTPMMDKRELIEIAKRSLKIYDKVQGEFGFNFLLRKDGYLKVANHMDMEQLIEEYRLQKSMGVKVREVDPYEIREIVRGFNPESVAGGILGEGGVIFPWPVIWGFVKECENLGVKIKKNSEVKEFVIENNEIKGLKTEEGHIDFDYVVNACGAWSNQMNRIAGIEIENKIIKEEVCVIESLKPFIDPYILNISNGVYLSQSARGEIVGGIIGREVTEPDTSSTLDFLVRYAKKAVEMIPSLKGLSVLRQWGGVYDVSKDDLPIVGEDKVKGLVLVCGLGRRGMSLAPAIGELACNIVVRGKGYDHFSPRRFYNSGKGEV